MERFSLISPEPHMPDTDLRLRKLMEIEEAIEAYVRDNDVSRLNQLLSDPEYESLFLKRLRLTNRHEIWNIIHLPPEERKNRLLPYRQLGFHCYRKQLVSIPCIRMAYAYHGKTQINIEDENFTLQEDELCLLNADVNYKIINATKDAFFIDCFFTKFYLSNELMPRLPRDSIFTPFFEQALFGANFSGKNNYILFQKSPSDKVLRFLIYSLLAFSGNVPLMDEVLSSYLFLIFHELLLRYNNERVISPSSKLKGIPPNASELIDYIFKHYDSVSLSSASAHFHFNPQYMGKLVRRLTGESFVDLVRNIRLIKAAELISETDRSIAVIANEVGYQNISYFYRLFQDHYGCTPAEYRDLSSSGHSHS